MPFGAIGFRNVSSLILHVFCYDFLCLPPNFYPEFSDVWRSANTRQAQDQNEMGLLRYGEYAQS